MGIALDELDRAHFWLAACVLPLVIFPAAAALLPAAVAAGAISKLTWPAFQLIWLLPLALIPVVWILETRGRRLAAVACVAAGATVGTVYVKRAAASELDRAPSARALWSQVAAHPDQVCIEGLDRGLQYALNYYSGTALPDCAQSQKPLRIRESAGRPYLSGSAASEIRVDPRLCRIVTSTLRE
jgi:hypothetical protein